MPGHLIPRLLLLMLACGCSVGSLAPRIGITAGRKIGQTGGTSTLRARGSSYLFVTATLARRPPPGPVVVSRPPVTPLPTPSSLPRSSPLHRDRARAAGRFA
ncbi:MAG: hypothetical protein GXP55_21090 [Deltaproteobacteria bacterium]|nr:hypothetical protein [Deltaproteobacteria bacterium]